MSLESRNLVLSVEATALLHTTVWTVFTAGGSARLNLEIVLSSASYLSWRWLRSVMRLRDLAMM